jgi:molybdate transport system substrate-binding protein
MVHSGAGMRGPVAEAAEKFTADTGVKVDISYSGSNMLLGQIDLTHRGDVYIPGDADYVEMARGKSLVTYDRPICRFVPVIMVARGNPEQIKGLADLARPKLRLGVGDREACAVGRVTERLMIKNDVDPQKIAANVVLTTPTVNELALKIKLHTVDAAIVWDSIAAQYPQDGEAIAIPPEHNIAPVVAGATLTCSSNPAAARAFLDFLASRQGRDIFAKHHYTVDTP